MGKKTALAAMAAAMLLALTLPFAAATTTAASLTLDGNGTPDILDYQMLCQLLTG